MKRFAFAQHEAKYPVLNVRSTLHAARHFMSAGHFTSRTGYFIEKAVCITQTAFSGCGTRYLTVCFAPLAYCWLRHPKRSLRYRRRRFRLKTCHRHVFLTPKLSRVQVHNQEKPKTAPLGYCFGFLAAELGLEPRQTESESVVLPITQFRNIRFPEHRPADYYYTHQ